MYSWHLEHCSQQKLITHAWFSHPFLSAVKLDYPPTFTVCVKIIFG